MHGSARDQGVPPGPAAVEPLALRTFEAAVGYGLVILAASWVLGSVRKFLVLFGVDPLMASLSQAVATLLILTQAAGWVVRTFGVPWRLGLRLSVGLGAVALFGACDALSALLLFGLSPLDLIAELTGLQGLVIGLMLVAAAVLPAVRGRPNET